MELTLRPTRKQTEALRVLRDDRIRFVLFGGGAGGGKSWLGCEWLLMNCVVYPGSKWFIARKELKRLMNSTYITFNKVLSWHNVSQNAWSLNSKYNYIEFSNGSRIDLLDVAYLPTDPLYERLGSLEYTGGFMEEVGEINELAYDVLKSRVNRHKNKEFKIPGRIFCTCNPTKNWVKKEFYVPYKQGRLPETHAFIESLYSDNPHTAEDYGESLAEIKNESVRNRLMSGDWDYEDVGTVFRGIDECIGGQLGEPKEDRSYIVGVDVAKHVDYTVITVLDRVDFSVVHFERFNQIDWEFQRKKIGWVSTKYNQAPIYIDSTGVGDPIAEALDRAGYVVEQYKYTNAKKKYLIDNLAFKIEQQEISFPDIPELVEELRAFTFETTPSGNITYNAPSGYHDDCVNSLALAVYGAGHYPEEPVEIKKPYEPGTLGHLEEQLQAQELEKDLEFF